MKVVEVPASVMFSIDRFSVVITRSPELIKESQALRHRVFYQEMAGQAVDTLSPPTLDEDEFDMHCDHLIVLYQNENKQEPEIIGTYRILRHEDMLKLGRFYTQSEFDISNLMTHKGEKVMELGRSCVDPTHRNGTVIQLLWRAIAAYIEQYDVQTLFGCASFSGTDMRQHQIGLSYLHHYHRLPVDMQPTPLPHVRANFDLLPIDQIDKRRAFVGLPPLIKGYLRLGAYVGEGAVIDQECNTTDVCIVLDRTLMTERYFSRFSNEQATESSAPLHVQVAT